MGAVVVLQFKEYILPMDRLRLLSAKARLWRWWLDEVVNAPLEPILHPSRARLQYLGAFTILGHLAFGWIWIALLPQPYENLGTRLAMASLGIPLLVDLINRDLTSKATLWIYSATCWLQLPMFFSLMYWLNGGNAVWLASMACMLVIYYHLTDWRLATLGVVAGVIASMGMAHTMQAGFGTEATQADHLVVLAFAWGAALVLGASSANLRRTRLINTLSTMGVMAHELRTPLATVHLMGDVLRNLSQHDLPESRQKKFDELATRLQNLVRSMNRQIDTQISNAQLTRLPRDQSLIQAAELVQEVVLNYPYRSSRERDCVLVHIQQDFQFVASRQLFSQVLTNLLKNALHALASASQAPSPGDLRVDVGVHHGKGRIAVSDDGIGIAHDQQARIFEPFFSTLAGAGNGLGLTFCKNVVEAARGSLSVHSEPGLGAVFMIDLPMNKPTVPAPVSPR
ncbi:MAG: HAMP domain-containing sensor histidine kinase [Hydrogenophaga sp.]|uniref:sensor histidine kinase n=1 Tax=Hydrogenophaga sp. TaxID=1904254 RepID=UPI00260675DD|nr:HAMP domain-containing sensor histidine kinase [Hydrogenophaga sp.]MDM7943860.1 HAMP domain-containing sensor histidine kinase [Hydrogenophaga sp.]